jgi:superfamily I DNA and RNA helicase
MVIYSLDNDQRKIINNFVKQYKEKELQWKTLYFQH